MGIEGLHDERHPGRPRTFEDHEMADHNCIDHQIMLTGKKADDYRIEDISLSSLECA